MFCMRRSRKVNIFWGHVDLNVTCFSYWELLTNKNQPVMHIWHNHIFAILQLTWICGLFHNNMTEQYPNWATHTCKVYVMSVTPSERNTFASEPCRNYCCIKSCSHYSISVSSPTVRYERPRYFGIWSCGINWSSLPLNDWFGEDT